jgi:hypothetical protein
MTSGDALALSIGVAIIVFVLVCVAFWCDGKFGDHR